jgi:acetyl esterase/lipase
VSLTLRVALSALTRPTTLSFGDDPSQVGELHLPVRADGPRPVAVLLHGGYWQTRFGKLVCRPLARDLVRRGCAVWNLEYRRLGDGRRGGGGWPMTFDDVATGIDHLASLHDPRLDLGRVVVIGHSAGGQLALWAASRQRPVVAVHGIVALAPVTDLARAGVHARTLLGGTPEQVPERWAVADPMRSAPPSVPTLVVHPSADETVSSARSVAYGERCRALGSDITLVVPDGESHRDPIDPSSASWAAAVQWLRQRGHVAA